MERIKRAEMERIKRALEAALRAPVEGPDILPYQVPTRREARGFLNPAVDITQKRLGPTKYTRRLVRRNEKCPFCTSGKKFKHCHGGPVQTTQAVLAFAGHPQEHPAQYACYPIQPKRPRPAKRMVLDE